MIEELPAKDKKIEIVEGDKREIRVNERISDIALLEYLQHVKTIDPYLSNTATDELYQ